MYLPMSLDTLHYFADWADKLKGRCIPTAGYFGRQTLNYTRLEPVGVAALVVPQNAPLMIAVWKLAPWPPLLRPGYWAAPRRHRHFPAPRWAHPSAYATASACSVLSRAPRRRVRAG